MSPPAFTAGEKATVDTGSYGEPMPVAVLTVVTVKARVTLSDGSVWHDSRGMWREYGTSPKHGPWAKLRPVEPGDIEAVREMAAKAKAEREYRAMVERVSYMHRSDVEALPVDALRQIVALLDAAKGGPS